VEAELREQRRRPRRRRDPAEEAGGDPARDRRLPAPEELEALRLRLRPGTGGEDAVGRSRVGDARGRDPGDAAAREVEDASVERDEVEPGGEPGPLADAVER